MCVHTCVCVCVCAYVRVRVCVCVCVDGRALLVNLHQRVVLCHFNFKKKVYDLKFSPDGRHVCVCVCVCVHHHVCI